MTAIKKLKIMLGGLVITSSFLLGGTVGAQGKISLDKAIPIDDIAIAYTNKVDYPVFELKDTTHQLQNKYNRSYDDIIQEINDYYADVVETDDQIATITKDGSVFIQDK